MTDQKKTRARIEPDWRERDVIVMESIAHHNDAAEIAELKAKAGAHDIIYRDAFGFPAIRKDAVAAAASKLTSMLDGLASLPWFKDPTRFEVQEQADLCEKLSRKFAAVIWEIQSDIELNGFRIQRECDDLDELQACIGDLSRASVRDLED
jgi:hypothetical protein